ASPTFFLTMRPPPTPTLFPTRRSSDLSISANIPLAMKRLLMVPFTHVFFSIGGRDAVGIEPGKRVYISQAPERGLKGAPAWIQRSEEHTSELQSRENLVCRLLLEKKKN